MSFIAQYTSRIKTSVKGRYKGQIEGYRTRFELLVNSLILKIIPVIIQSVYTCSRKNNSSFGHLPCFNVTIYHEHCNLIKFIKMNVWMLKSFFFSTNQMDENNFSFKFWVQVQWFFFSSENRLCMFNCVSNQQMVTLGMQTCQSCILYNIWSKFSFYFKKN